MLGLARLAKDLDRLGSGHANSVLAGWVCGRRDALAPLMAPKPVLQDRLRLISICRVFVASEKSASLNRLDLRAASIASPIRTPSTACDCTER